MLGIFWLSLPNAGASVDNSRLVKRRNHVIANGTFYRWKSKYGGMDVSEVKRLKELEAENAKLKKLLAETMLEKTALEDVVSRKW